MKVGDREDKRYSYNDYDGVTENIAQALWAIANELAHLNDEGLITHRPI